MSYFAFDRTVRRGVCRLGLALTLFSGLAGNIVPQSTNEDAAKLRLHVGIAPAAASEDSSEGLEVALALAALLRSARTVVADHQHLINDPDRSAPGFDGESVLAASLSLLGESGSDIPQSLDGSDRRGRLLGLQAQAIQEIIDENRHVIEQPGVAFKGFVPAVFARLVNERFGEKAEGEALLKITAPLELVRNRRSRPDAWERSVIEERFLSPDWPYGERHVETTEIDGREAFRVMVPEYYGAACLACHGSPAGEMDITGYPKEGAELNTLGGAISIALFR